MPKVLIKLICNAGKSRELYKALVKKYSQENFKLYHGDTIYGHKVAVGIFYVVEIANYDKDVEKLFFDSLFPDVIGTYEVFESQRQNEQDLVYHTLQIKRQIEKMHISATIMFSSLIDRLMIHLPPSDNQNARDFINQVIQRISSSLTYKHQVTINSESGDNIIEIFYSDMKG